jgi:hypothetical protein
MSFAADTALPAIRTEPVPAGADPDITSVQHWSGAAACATLWALFILYAAIQGVS